MKQKLIDIAKSIGFGLGALLAAAIVLVITQKVFTLDNSVINFAVSVIELGLFCTGILSLGKFIRSKLPKKG